MYTPPSKSELYTQAQAYSLQQGGSDSHKVIDKEWKNAFDNKPFKTVPVPLKYILVKS